MPATEGVPTIVIVSANQEAVTPVGKPDAVPMPVAPVVPILIFVNAVFTVTVGLDVGILAVLSVQVVNDISLP